MADITCVASGNWSNPAIWSPQPPQDGDSVNLQNYAVRLDVDVAQPNTLVWTTGTGYVYWDGSGTRSVSMRADAGNHTVSWNGIVRNTGSGTLMWNGPVKGGSSNYSFGANNVSNGTVIVTTATGGSGSSSYGVANVGSGTVNVTTATGGSGSSSYGVANVGSGTVNVTTATGGSGMYSYGVHNASNGTAIVTTATGGSGMYSYGIHNASNGTLTVVTAINASSGAAGAYGASSLGTTRVRQLVSAPNGLWRDMGYVLLEDHPDNSVQFRLAVNGATKTLLDATAGADFPAPQHVRAGVAYDNGDKVGTCAVPAPQYVALGVPVDHTVGQAVLTPETVRAALGMAAANLDAQLAAIAADADSAEAICAKLNTMLEQVGASWRFTVQALSNAPGTDAASVADAVWDEARSGHATSGTFGAVAEWAGQVSPQLIADAMQVAPTGAAQAGSVQARLQALQGDVDAVRGVTDQIVVSSVTVAPVLHAGTLRMTAKASLEATFSVPYIPAGWTRMWFTAKVSPLEADANAVLQVRISNPSAADDGLRYVAGKTPTEAGLQRSNASLAVDTGQNRVTLQASAACMSKFSAPYRHLSWDIKAADSNGAVTVLAEGDGYLTLTETHAIA